jgi:hypothetical protein
VTQCIEEAQKLACNRKTEQHQVKDQLIKLPPYIASLLELTGSNVSKIQEFCNYNAFMQLSGLLSEAVTHGLSHS